MDYSIVAKILTDCFKVDAFDYGHSKVLTIAHDTDRSFLYNGKCYSPLIDTIEDDLAKQGMRCLSFARVISRIKGELSYGNVCSPDGRFARALVTKRLKGLFANSEYPYSGMEESTWGEILDVTRAEKVVGILPSKELCTACRKRGVWVADVQHGVIADKHAWYGADYRAPDFIERTPHAFLVWDQGSAQVIRKWAEQKGVVTRVTGNRWLARFLNPRNDDKLVQELIQKFDRESGDVTKKTILVSLSWGEDNIPNGFIADGLQKTIRKTADEYRWLIRLHPNQLRGFATHEYSRFLRYFDSELRDAASWELSTVSPLPVVLKRTDLHISWASSVCIEAAQMGVKSALLDPRLRSAGALLNYYDHYCRSGMIDLIEESENSIESWIKMNLNHRHGSEDYSSYDAEYADLLSFLGQ